jgi:hypothetical protein
LYLWRWSDGAIVTDADAEDAQKGVNCIGWQNALFAASVQLRAIPAEVAEIERMQGCKLLEFTNQVKECGGEPEETIRFRLTDDTLIQARGK